MASPIGVLTLSATRASRDTGDFPYEKFIPVGAALDAIWLSTGKTGSGFAGLCLLS